MKNNFPASSKPRPQAAAAPAVGAGLGLLLLSCCCFILKAITGATVGPDGVLHEWFFLLPVGAALALCAVVVLAVAGLYSLARVVLGCESRRADLWAGLLCGGALGICAWGLTVLLQVHRV